jgi:hypothetical protein
MYDPRTTDDAAPWALAYAGRLWIDTDGRTGPPKEPPGRNPAAALRKAAPFPSGASQTGLPVCALASGQMDATRTAAAAIAWYVAMNTSNPRSHLWLTLESLGLNIRGSGLDTVSQRV